MARAAGFKQAWLNPINVIPEGTAVHRVDFDTGLHVDLHSSLYAPNNPLEVRADMPMTEIRDWIKQENQQGDFRILIDFVWKHVSVHSTLVTTHEQWFAKSPKIKDIIEYQFKHPDQQVIHEIHQHLKATAQLFLDKNKGFGFDGLRIDSASHINPELRNELYQYIRDAFPNAVILEECLFDSKQSSLINQLASEAEENNVYSDFITSNLYYQKPSIRGELAMPADMNDKQKLRLAKQNGVSFTGNHDHFSAGWSIILSMAATRLVNDSSFMEQIQAISTSVFTDDRIHPDKIKHAIELLHTLNTITKKGDEHKGKLPEELEPDQLACIRYLLPYANDIARELLSPTSSHQPVFEEFRQKLLERIANRTMPAQSGYFVLFSELRSPLETQRIFFNKDQKPLLQLLLTVNDLKENVTLTNEIINSILADKKTYNNAACFVKAIKSKQLMSHTKTKAKAKAKHRQEQQARPDSELRIWLPFIIEYLRNNPDINTYECYSNSGMANAMEKLQEALGTVPFIKSLNEIYRELSTPACLNYHTFTALRLYKIFIRCSEHSTDIIILNLNPTIIKIIDDQDIEKIALWFQARIYPPENVGLKEVLEPPFNSLPPRYIHDYETRWKAKTPPSDFDHSHTRITGYSANHQTNLYLGHGLDLQLANYHHIHVKKHVKSQIQIEDDIFTSPTRTTPIAKLTSPISEGKPSATATLFVQQPGTNGEQATKTTRRKLSFNP